MQIEIQIRTNSISFIVKRTHLMHLQTTLVLSNSHCSFKTNQRSQFSNFSHPLKLLQKTDNQLIQIFTKQQLTTTSGFQRKTSSIRSTKDKFRETAPSNFNTSKQPQYFNQDDGILEHIYRKTLTCSKPTSSKPQSHFQTRSTKQCKWFNPNYLSKQQKCFILFGFSINMLEIQHFHASHPQLNLNIKFYQYSDNDYFREVQIKSLQQETLEQIPGKYQGVLDALEGEDLLDCEQVSFVVTFWQNGMDINNKNGRREDEQLNKTYMYFFPNINALRSQQQRKQQRTQLTIGMPISTTTQKPDHKISGVTHDSETLHQSMTSLRKSHQNFRILQVLEYYLKLQCHSEHIMITSNESRIIREFLGLVYEQSLKEFFVFIDHERKGIGKSGKDTVRSIMGGKAKEQTDQHERDESLISRRKIEEPTDESPLSSKVYSSDICSEKEFISVEGQLIINDEFLSKLSQIKLPEPWLDSPEFREQKKLMYKMKLQEYTENKELKHMKDEFTDTINYLKSLVGQQKVGYDQISIESLKVIKNAKIRHSTQEVKQLQKIWQEKEIRNEELKQKLKQYENQKNIKNQDHEQNLGQLRREILAVQKQLNLHKIQLSAIYDAHAEKENEFDQKDEMSCNVSKMTQTKSKHLDKSSVGWRSQGKSTTQGFKMSSTQNKQSSFLGTKTKNFTQNVLSTTSQQPDILQASFLKSSRLSVTKGSIISGMTLSGKMPFQMPLRGESFVINRRSSQLFSKYTPILEHLRKQKYEQSLKQEMAKCEFEAEKEFEKYKQEYTRACKELSNVLNDCD